MTDTQVQQARTTIEAGAPRLVHVIEPNLTVEKDGLTTIHLWTAEGSDVAEYYTYDDGSFAGGTIGITGSSMQLPFTDLVAFVASLIIVGGHR